MAATGPFRAESDWRHSPASVIIWQPVAFWVSCFRHLWAAWGHVWLKRSGAVSEPARSRTVNDGPVNAAFVERTLEIREIKQNNAGETFEFKGSFVWLQQLVICRIPNCILPHYGTDNCCCCTWSQRQTTFSMCYTLKHMEEDAAATEKDNVFSTAVPLEQHGSAIGDVNVGWKLLSRCFSGVSLQQVLHGRVKKNWVQAHRQSRHFSWETVLFSVMGYYNHRAWKAMYDSSFPTRSPPFPSPAQPQPGQEKYWV